MSVRPIQFNGMIQNTHEVASTRTQENNKGEMQQVNASVEMTRQDEQKATTVKSKDDADGSEYTFDREGDGKGYEGNKKKKEENKDGKVAKTTSKDGAVFVKHAVSSFSTTI